MIIKDEDEQRCLKITLNAESGLALSKMSSANTGTKIGMVINNHLTFYATIESTLPESFLITGWDEIEKQLSPAK